VQSYASGAFRLFDLNPGHAPRIQSLLRRYADQPMDLADATLVVLAEQLGESRILSTDVRDFRVYRWKNRRPFDNILVRRMRGGHV
jgi:predicted nucleic acid-binding protein